MNSGDKHVPKDINLSSEIPDAPSEIIRKAAVRTLAAVPVRMMEFAEEIHPPIGEAITDFANTVSKKVGQLAGERPRVYSPAQAKNAVGLAITSASLAATAYAYSRSQEEEKKMRNEAQIGALLKQQGASDAKVGKLEAKVGKLEANQGETIATQGEIIATLGEVKATLGEVKAKQGEILEHLTKNPPSPPYRSPAEIIKEGLNKTGAVVPKKP